VIGLDEPISTWRPDLPHAATVTPRQLASMTAGYPDYVPDPRFQQASEADPYKDWTPAELLSYSFSQERAFEPGHDVGLFAQQLRGPRVGAQTGHRNFTGRTIGHP
jgi:CubicO group peptidase (beta-lactamase class C family)